VVETYIENKYFLNCSANSKPSAQEWQALEEFHENMTNRDEYDFGKIFKNGHS